MANNENTKTFTYYWATRFYAYRATDTSDALRQMRADLSAMAAREAMLVSVK